MGFRAIGVLGLGFWGWEVGFKAGTLRLKRVPISRETRVPNALDQLTLENVSFIMETTARMLCETTPLRDVWHRHVWHHRAIAVINPTP